MIDPKNLFAALFEPRRIALIGASADSTKTTSRPQRFLRKHGFTGEILPVNPSRSEILGEKAYKDLEAIPGEIDHAYILLNGRGAVEALAACGKRGVKVASILAGGFADAGAAGASLQDDLTRIVAVPASGGRAHSTARWRRQVLTANAAFATTCSRRGEPAAVLIAALVSQSADARYSFAADLGQRSRLVVGDRDLMVDDPGTTRSCCSETLAMVTVSPVRRGALCRGRAGDRSPGLRSARLAVAYRLSPADVTFDAFWRRHTHRARVDVPILADAALKSI